MRNYLFIKVITNVNSSFFDMDYARMIGLRFVGNESLMIPLTMKISDSRQAQCADDFFLARGNRAHRISSRRR